jgi:hypothetical protein
VADGSGAVIPDATVTLRNTQTAQEQIAVTNRSGTAIFPFLKPSTYSLLVHRSNFSDLALDRISLNVGDSKVLSVNLKVGTQSEVITVDGDGLTLNTTDASVSTVVDRNFVENVPLNGRSFQALISLTPGVTSQNPNNTSQASGLSGEFSVNGQRAESNVYSVDGVSANTGGYSYGYGTSGTSGSLPAATALGTTQSLVSVDALQEFRVSSSSYSAEYGLSPGGQFTFTTRSGANQVHGTAFDYLRNNFFDANDWFNNNLGQSPTALRQNDFGGTLGGPVEIPKLYNGKVKSFFFFSYEGLRLTQPQAAVTNYVPSLSLRQSAAASIQPALNDFPLPTGTDLPNGLAPFVQAYSLPSSLDSTSIRIDHQLSSRVKLFFRFADTQSSASTRSLSTLTASTQSSFTNTLGATTAVSTRITDELRLNYTSNVGGSSTALDAFGGAHPISLLKLQGIDQYPTAFALVRLVFPGYSTGIGQSRTIQPQYSWDANDALTFAYGRHIFKAGVDYRSIASHLQTATPYVYSFFNSSSAVVNNSSYLSSAQAHGASFPKYINIALYLQDEFRVNDRLGLSLGLRWEVNPSPTQTTGILPYIVRGDLAQPTTLALAPAGTRFWNTTYLNFAPRFGLAYQAHRTPGRETVVRIGGGVFFDSGQQTSAQAFGNSPGQSASRVYRNVSYPLSPAQVAVSIVDPPSAPYSVGYYFPNRLQLPYSLQWNLSIEQALSKSQALTISYLGSAGRRLPSQQILSGAATAPNFSSIYNATSGTTADYDALQVQFQRTLSRGLQVLASYGWSHSIDFGSQDVDFAQIRGNSDYDLRHNLNIAVSYDPVIDHPTRVLDNIVNHWGVDSRFSARTAFPVILNGNYSSGPNGQTYYSGLNLIAGVPVYLHVPGIAGGRQINPAAFALPATHQYGDAPRNFVRGFGANQIDMAIRRVIPLREGMTLQFRAESFNILNHPNFGYTQPTFGNAQFGQATKMLNQSLGTLSALYQQGGPRSMQFALKLVF